MFSRSLNLMRLFPGLWRSQFSMIIWNRGRYLGILTKWWLCKCSVLCPNVHCSFLAVGWSATVERWPLISLFWYVSIVTNIERQCCQGFVSKVCPSAAACKDDEEFESFLWATLKDVEDNIGKIRELWILIGSRWVIRALSCIKDSTLRS